MFQFPANPTLGQQYSPTQGVTYEWNGTGWIFLGLNTASLYPPGIILPYAGAAPIPFQGWVLCDGSSYATNALPALFGVIGYSYGGSGANFNVPDLRGRVIAGVDAGAGRLSSGTLGAGLGAESVTLTAAQAPSHAHGITDVAHSHGVSDPGHAHGISDPGHGHGVNDPGHTHQYETAGSSGHFEFGKQGPGPNGVYRVNSHTQSAGTGISIAGSGTGIGIHGAGTGIGIAASGTGLSATGAAGGGQAHANVQPTMVLNYLIKA